MQKRLRDGDRVTNQHGASQAHVAARFDCLPCGAMKVVAECFGFGAEKYGEENWHKITIADHLNHASHHVNEHRRGDSTEMHLVNNAVRALMALELWLKATQTAPQYWHPDLRATTEETDATETDTEEKLPNHQRMATQRCCVCQSDIHNNEGQIIKITGKWICDKCRSKSWPNCE